MPDFRGKVVKFPDVEVIRATAAAILVEIEGEEIWIPQNQIDDESESGLLIISEWIAEKKGLV